MLNDKATDNARVRAAEVLLDRRYGRPLQPTAIATTDAPSLSNLGRGAFLLPHLLPRCSEVHYRSLKTLEFFPGPI